MYSLWSVDRCDLDIDGAGKLACIPLAICGPAADDVYAWSGTVIVGLQRLFQRHQSLGQCAVVAVDVHHTHFLSSGIVSQTIHFDAAIESAGTLGRCIPRIVAQPHDATSALIDDHRCDGDVVFVGGVLCVSSSPETLL